MKEEVVQEWTSLVTEVELKRSRAPSPLDAKIKIPAGQTQQMPPEQTTAARRLGQVNYYAIDINEPPDKPRIQCCKVPVRLTVIGVGDAVLRATHGLSVLNRRRVHRLVHEARAQGGALRHEDLAFLLGVSLETVGAIYAYFAPRRSGDSAGGLA
jgi:hypothetical protein